MSADRVLPPLSPHELGGTGRFMLILQASQVGTPFWLFYSISISPSWHFLFFFIQPVHVLKRKRIQKPTKTKQRPIRKKTFVKLVVPKDFYSLYVSLILAEPPNVSLFGQFNLKMLALLPGYNVYFVLSIIDSLILFSSWHINRLMLSISNPYP